MLEEYPPGEKILRRLESGNGISRSDVRGIVRIAMNIMCDDLQTL